MLEVLPWYFMYHLLYPICSDGRLADLVGRFLFGCRASLSVSDD